MYMLENENWKKCHHKQNLSHLKLLGSLVILSFFLQLLCHYYCIIVRYESTQCCQRKEEMVTRMSYVDKVGLL